jgi:hypothetical protein
MVSLVLIKPDFVYDHNKKLYREFGTAEGKTIFSMPALAVGIAILLVILFNVLNISNNINNRDTSIKTKYKYKYVPVPMMSQMMPMTNSTYDTESIRNLQSDM